MSIGGSAAIRGAHAARVQARAARSRELFFVWALSFGSILPEVRFGEPPKPAREPRALPGTTDP